MLQILEWIEHFLTILKLLNKILDNIIIIKYALQNLICIFENFFYI